MCGCLECVLPDGYRLIVMDISIGIILLVIDMHCGILLRALASNCIPVSISVVAAALVVIMLQVCVCGGGVSVVEARFLLQEKDYFQ